jgi:hypothetical protein
VSFGIDMTRYYLSEPAQERLRELGKNLELAIDARETKSAFAARVGITRETLRKLCQGRAGLDWGIFVAVLDALGLLDHLAEVGQPEKDRLGQSLRLGRISPSDIHLDSNF